MFLDLREAALAQRPLNFHAEGTRILPLTLRDVQPLITVLIAGRAILNDLV